MIRRSDNTGGVERWVLISQVEHARLSGRLAEAWSGGGLAPLNPHAEMVAAITHHDDGWAAWEVAPKVDPHTGRPLDFTEMPLTDSLAIWRESIGRAADLGPLAAYMVSGHFSALLERFPDRWKSEATLQSLATGFLDEQRAERAHWLTAYQKVSGQQGDRATAEGVAWLQMFDAISLWLCCGERSQSEPFSMPDGASLTFRPVNGSYDLEVTPWPYREATLKLEVVGRSVPAMHYANPSDLVTAAAAAKTLKWVLKSGEK
jgi:hypothetical protein